MPQAKPRSDLSDLWNVLKANPPLLLALGLAVAIVLYIVYRNGPGANAAGKPTTTDVMTTPPLYSQPVVIEPTIPAGTGPTGPQGPPGPPGSVAPTPGTFFLGPSGVHHYVTTGNETLTQIASKLGAGYTWNSIYAIPDNQRLFGRLAATQARVYKPPAGMIITVPGSPTSGR